MENERHYLKETLLENISELFLRYGLRSTSMDDICNHLKMSKKTLYQFFTNKDDVVEQVMNYRRKKGTRDIDNLLKKDSIEIFFSIKKHITDDLETRLPANMFDIKKYHPEVYKKTMYCDKEQIYDLFKKILEAGIREGNFRKEIDVDIQLYIFTQQLLFLGEPETINTMEYPISAVISTIIDNFVRAVSTPKGIAAFETLCNTRKN